MCGDISLLEFPFDAELLAAGEERKLELAQQKAAAKRQAAQARLAETALPPPVRKAWPKALLWGMVGVAIVVAGIAAGVMVQRFPEKFTLRSPIVNTVPAAAPAEVPLGLLAERHNGDLKLTWNRQSGAIINATTGTLSIQDGEAKREITLDATQLHSGSILYAPATEQVQLQLTVAGPQSTTSESVIVVVPKVGSPQVQPVAHKELPAGLPAPTLAETMARYHPTRPFTAPSARPVTPSQPVIEPPVPVVRTDFTAVAPSLALVNPSLRAPQPPPPAAPAPNPAASQPAARPPAEVSPPIYYPPSIVHQVVPNFPGSLRGMVVISKTVEIKVLIDEAGKVLKADAMPSQDGTPQLMIRAALEAARKWKFHPARRGTTPISSEMILRFEFKPPS